MGGSQALEAGWNSPNSMTIKIDGSTSLYDASLITVVVSPHVPISPQITTDTQSGCDPAYPDFCIPPPPPDLDCATQYSDFKVLSPDPHDFDRNGNGICCEEGE